MIAATAADSIDATNSYLSQPYCRGIAVPDGPLLDELLAFNAKVIAAHPDYWGVTHHEVFVAPDGLCFCEIAARAGGGGVLAGFRSRTGLNLDQVALSAQLLDRVPQHIEVAGHLTGYALLYAGPGQLVRMPAAPTDDWVLEVQLLARPRPATRAAGRLGRRGGGGQRARREPGAGTAPARPADRTDARRADRGLTSDRDQPCYVWVTARVSLAGSVPAAA